MVSQVRINFLETVLCVSDQTLFVVVLVLQLIAKNKVRFCHLYLRT